jgi:uncharacterized membrane protein YjdF
MELARTAPMARDDTVGRSIRTRASGDQMLSMVKELASYMSARKKWWLMPVITILLVVGGLLVLAQGSAVAPFIYTLF